MKKRIMEEMTFDYSKVLEQNLDLAKQFIRLGESGEVEVLVKEKLPGPDRILLYLVGKLYAREAGLATADEVGNNELMEKLGIPSGSLLPWLKALRDENRIKQIERERYAYHFIPITQVDVILKDIMKKLQVNAPSAGPPRAVVSSLPDSLAEFIKSKGSPNKHSVLIIVFGYWLFHKLNQTAFSVKDVKKCYDDARIPESSNTSAYMNDAQYQGYFKRLDEKKDSHVAWTVTQTGDKFVDEEQWKAVE